jgi:hypothetical protein
MRLDVAGANRDQLVLAGVAEENIHMSGLCTAEHLDVLTSYRAEKAKAGRIAAAIRAARASRYRRLTSSRTPTGTPRGPLLNPNPLIRFQRQQIADDRGFALAMEEAPAHAERKTEDVVVVKIITPTDKSSLPGKLAEAELHFTEGVLDGLKLIGFTIWERRTGGGRNVTFPARQYSVNGERRSFALLRPAAGDAAAQDRVRELILDAYAEFEEKAAVAS